MGSLSSSCPDLRKMAFFDITQLEVNLWCLLWCTYLLLIISQLWSDGLMKNSFVQIGAIRFHRFCNALHCIVMCAVISPPWVRSMSNLNSSHIWPYGKFQIICNTHRDWLQDNRWNIIGIIFLYRCPVSNLIGEQYVHFHLILSHRHIYDICDHYWNPPPQIICSIWGWLPYKGGRLLGPCLIVQCQSCYHILIRIV